MNNYLGAWCILGLIWWATNKLTWDSTVIDDELDASGEGLLQAANLDVLETQKDLSGADDVKQANPKSVRVGSRKPAWWRLFYRQTAKGAAQPHAPGIWVVYFSLAALPVFGLGQGLILGSDTAARERAFFFVVVYLAAALGLLLITSFLGLRRYLRQRHLTMPPVISATWVNMGSSLILIIVVGCMLLPRPNASWSIGAMIERFGDPHRETTRRSGTDSSVGDPSKPAGAAVAGHEAGSQENDQASHAESNSTGIAPAQIASDISNESHGSGITVGQRSPPGGNQAGQLQPGERASPAHSRAGTGNWLKPAIYALFITGVAFIVWKNRNLILLLLHHCWSALQQLWRQLFAPKPGSASENQTLSTQSAIAPFTTFSNPFSTGTAERMSLRDLIVYTFNALEAWAAGYNCGRDPDQTPFEFAESLGDQIPDIAHDAHQVTRLYVQVAYGTIIELPACRSILELLWSKMTRDDVGITT